MGRQLVGSDVTSDVPAGHRLVEEAGDHVAEPVRGAGDVLTAVYSAAISEAWCPWDWWVMSG